MVTDAVATALATEWIAAWNAHDLERILSHYAVDVRFSSPFVEALGAGQSGILEGREALRSYFSTALVRYPRLEFRLHHVFRGVETITLMYDSVNGLLAAETMALTAGGQVSRVWAQYCNRA